MSMNRAEEALQYVEKMFVRYGALPEENDPSSPAAAAGLRTCYVHNGTFYRAEEAELDGQQVIIISATDNRAYARAGIHDNIAGFSADYPEEKLEREVRFILGVEPYPDTYPVY